jgi:hypothetical protein
MSATAHSRLTARTTACAIAAFLAAVLLACSGKEGKACYQGDYEACACGDGAAVLIGYAQCGATASYGACDCSGSYPFLPDAGLQDAPADTPTLHTITQPCTTAADCVAPLECFHFNARGPACTHPCMVDRDCEAPSPGCSGMKVCKSG